MKKRSIKNLNLNKKTISTVKITSTIGGDVWSTLRECKQTCIFSLQGNTSCIGNC